MNVFVFFLIMGFLGDNNPQPLDNQTPTHYSSNSDHQDKFPYRINHPDEIFELPAYLKEISGLSLSLDGQQIYAINDENGILFYINKNTGSVERQVNFYKDGDYEGIEVVGDKIYIVKSTGTIYQINQIEGDTASIVKKKFFLKKEHDIEGLAFDKSNNRLLIACKGKHCHHGHKVCSIDDCNLRKAIYGLDLNEEKLLPTPVFEISLEEVQTHLKATCTTEAAIKKFKAFLKPKDEKKFKFNPSGIAIHPISRQIYVLASKGKTIAILNQDGSIAHLEKLNKKIHTQPEGIVFDADGTLYISNEGKENGNGTICKFLYKEI